MNTKRWTQIQTLFDQVLEMEPESRDQFLKDKCAGDNELYTEITSLLSADENVHDLLDGLAIDTIIPIEELSLEGETVGNYKISHKIASGGMGAVYLAQRSDGHFDRSVALKVIKKGMDSEQVLKRFHRERQILAKLQHPNIARLLDAGLTKDGRPYFIMEYIDGLPINEYCDKNRLTIKERLNLFQTVCETVSYAHRNLVVHRDLKPGNIFITSEGIVKLLDFGIAAVLDDSIETEGQLTKIGQHILTPEYASPEQARGERIDTATDIYSLGMVFYELLTGIRPYELGHLSPSEIEKVICTTKPEKPSSAIRKLETLKTTSGESQRNLQKLSELRKSPPERLIKILSGDLDNICMMALKKEAEHRYASVEQFRADISSHLTGRPVQARPDTFGYRAQKFIQRNKFRLATAGAVLFFVLVLILFYTVQLATERDRAQLEAQKAEQVSMFLTELFKLSDPSQSKGKIITARELLDRGAARIETDLADQPEVHAQMLHVIGGVYNSLGLYEDAERLLDQALIERQKIYGEDNIEVARTLKALGVLYETLGRFEDAARMQRLAIAILRTFSNNYQIDLANSLHGLAHAQMRLYQLDDAERLIREAVDIKQKELGERHAEVAYSLNILGDVFAYQRKGAEAEEVHREVLAMRRELLGDDHPDVTVTLHNLAAALRTQERYTDAEGVFREVLARNKRILGAEHPEVPNVMSQLAFILQKQGRSIESAAQEREALTIYRKVYKDDHPRTAKSLGQYGKALADQGLYKEAEASYSEAIQMKHRLNYKKDNNPIEIWWHAGLAKTIWQQARYEEAEQVLQESQRLCESFNDTKVNCMSTLRLYFVELYTAWGRVDEAEKYK